VKIRVFLVFLILSTLICCKKDRPPAKSNYFFETQLFKDVQGNAIFTDSKTFVDLIPKASYDTLENRYLAIKEQDTFSLKAFVENNFYSRPMKSLAFYTDSTPTMYEHIESMWDKLTRGPDTSLTYSSRIPLPNKYVVPGGRFQEIYYWDSYFTIEGLLASDRRGLAKNMVDNFAFLLDSVGHIPNGTRTYYLTRSQPPFFSLMVGALAREEPKIISDYLPALLKEYHYFMEHDSVDENNSASKHVVRMKNGKLLNRYYDEGNAPRPEAYKEDFNLASLAYKRGRKKKHLYKDLRSAAESGWDFSSRWYGAEGDMASTKTTSIVPVDLNCLMYHLELQISKVYSLKGEEAQAQHYNALANSRKQMISRYFWDEHIGYFMDYNFKQERQREELTLAGAFPLYFGLATDEQAKTVKQTLMTKFLKAGGLVTTLNKSGQQWDAPNGWAPLQWMAVNGLLRYGYEEEANEIMRRWLSLNEKVYKDTGKMMEKYNVEDLSLHSGGGEYETQDGFGWTNGVALGFKIILEDTLVSSQMQD